MRIEVWSDVVCPWCYIGKRRLERALADHDGDVEVVWRSFQLDPSAPALPVESVAEHLGRKYGGGVEAGLAMIDRVDAVAAEEGLVYRQREAQRANTVDAHRLLHLAAETGHQGALKEALLAAYFTEARNIADHATLRELATAVGMPEGDVDGVLATDRFRDDVEADVRQAAAYGATGVPFFVVDGRYGISGAQPVEVFRQVLERAAADRRVEMVQAADGDGEVCGPDGCAV
ncbi:MAG: DsbA family oxidoreductase [Nocardioidaceae bacterium]